MVCGSADVLAERCWMGESESAESLPRGAGEQALANSAPMAAKGALRASTHTFAGSSAGSMSTQRSNGTSTAGSKTSAMSREQAARQWWLQTIAREKYARVAMTEMLSSVVLE